jgi:hypothetical protein
MNRRSGIEYYWRELGSKELKREILSKYRKLVIEPREETTYWSSYSYNSQKNEWLTLEPFVRTEISYCAAIIAHISEGSFEVEFNKWKKIVWEIIDPKKIDKRAVRAILRRIRKLELKSQDRINVEESIVCLSEYRLFKSGTKREEINLENYFENI